MTREKTDFWVGLFVVLGAMALVFLALQAGNMNSFSFAPTYKVQAHFDNLGGLKVRAPVKSSGVVVGRVASIGFDNERFQAVATLELEQQYNFPSDSSASILTSGLLGEQYIGLTPGGEDKMLEQNSEIQYTQSAVVLEELISKFLYSSASNQGTASSDPAAAPPVSTEHNSIKPDVTAGPESIPAPASKP
ncbi:outer membrane lipid asymmetry maintenance protein MlaD [Candidimonas sp. SYP-B2681]|uniref:outer membrane lipid asymmetry maintenance protein MlaD n=1 Tax=Candidimonas sp. SYP-B2681 TaxID=2497686 RepID=UPI000F8756D3|nr:outer membrane lipid asymmetry maintenance protein MlaD [Candidimonas sp. SYP-B2681]RTZ43258.1 outer membrane lipid asymmetry maintenance protein MlaD [Candidimonas sp. SYP-B2681]